VRWVCGKYLAKMCWGRLVDSSVALLWGLEDDSVLWDFALMFCICVC
jgi:hypothetical protein